MPTPVMRVSMPVSMRALKPLAFLDHHARRSLAWRQRVRRITSRSASLDLREFQSGEA